MTQINYLQLVNDYVMSYIFMDSPYHLKEENKKV